MLPDVTSETPQSDSADDWIDRSLELIGKRAREEAPRVIAAGLRPRSCQSPDGEQPYFIEELPNAPMQQWVGNKPWSSTRDKDSPPPDVAGQS